MKGVQSQAAYNKFFYASVSVFVEDELWVFLQLKTDLKKITLHFPNENQQLFSISWEFNFDSGKIVNGVENLELVLIE